MVALRLLFSLLALELDWIELDWIGLDWIVADLIYKLYRHLPWRRTRGGVGEKREVADALIANLFSTPSSHFWCFPLLRFLITVLIDHFIRHWLLKAEDGPDYLEMKESLGLPLTWSLKIRGFFLGVQCFQNQIKCPSQVTSGFHTTKGSLSSPEELRRHGQGMIAFPRVSALLPLLSGSWKEL